MATAELARPARAARVDVRRLSANGTLVKMLQTILGQTESSADTLPALLCRIDREDAWREFLLSESPEEIHTAADFRQFIEGNRPGGCQTPLHVLERMVRETEAWPVFDELTRGKRGGNNNPEGRNQWGEVKCDNIILDQTQPATIPLPPPVDRKPPTGTSTSYVLRQLAKGRKLKTGEVIPPRPDLLERVRSGELTPHGAAVLGGFDGKSITIPADPAGAVRRLVRHFRGDDLAELVRGLANWAGIELAGSDDTRIEATPMKWFRVYHDALHDPKVQQLPLEQFKAWFNLLCMASANPERGHLPPLEDIAYTLRISVVRAGPSWTH